MERRLSAVLAADVVDYSRMMGADEAGTLSALRAFRSEIFGPTVAKLQGRIVKSMGDGWLVVFGSVAQAVSCALVVQDRLAETGTLRLRIGVHIGDVVHDADDIFGDGVNVAARLEALAEPGGIAISDSAHGSLDGTLAPSFDDAGLQRLKNIDRPVRVWMKGAIRAGGLSPARAKRNAGYPRLSIEPVATSDDRTEVRELAEGLTGDLDATLSAVRWLVSDVRREPEAGGYVLRCPLRSRGERLRLEARLFDPDGTPIWSDKFDGELADDFDWQDSTGEALSSNVMTAILDVERERLARIPIEDRTAEECVLHGLIQFRLSDGPSFAATLSSLALAIKRAPDFAAAYGDAIWTTYAGMTVGLESVRPFYDDQLPGWVADGRSLLGQNTLLDLGIALIDFGPRTDPTPLRSAIASALRRAPLDAQTLIYVGWSALWCGEISTAEDCFQRFERFGKAHPYYVPAKGGAALAALQRGDDATAIRRATEALEASTTYATLHAVRAAAHAHLDQMDEAREALAAYRKLVPGRTITAWRALNDYSGSEGGKRYFAGLRKAGLPD